MLTHGNRYYVHDGSHGFGKIDGTGLRKLILTHFTGKEDLVVENVG